MKASIDAIIRREQAEYLENLAPQSDKLLSEMEDYAANNGVPIADREVARFIEITARGNGARRVLEIGMAIGYTALHLARAMGEGGLVVTIEPNEEMIRLSESYFERAGVRERVRIERGYALEVIPKLNEKFDMIFLDALKEEYAAYLDASLKKLRSGGIVIADNLLWGGRVAQKGDVEEESASTKALREFNEIFVRHPKLIAQVLPVGDGLGYAVKVSD